MDGSSTNESRYEGYRRREGGWFVDRSAPVKASTAQQEDNFSAKIAISGCGATSAVGAWLEDSSATGIGGDQSSNAASNSGAVYVY